MNKRDRYLSQLLLLRLVDSQTLTLMIANRTTRASFVKWAMKNKFINSVHVRFSVNGRYRQATYYVPTRKCLKHLSLDSDENIFGDIPFETASSLSVMRKYELSDELRRRLSEQSSAIVLADKAGAAIPFSTFQSEPEVNEDQFDEDAEAEEESKSETESDEDAASKKQYIVSDYLRDSVLIDDHTGYGLIGNDTSESDRNYIVFHDARSIKRHAAMSMSSSLREGHSYFARGRYKGILDSHFKSVMVYVASQKGVSWTNWLSQSEMNAYRKWYMEKALADANTLYEEEASAILIVKNFGQFESVFLDYEGKRRDRKDPQSISPLSGPFSNMYAITLDEDGARLLNAIMTTPRKNMYGSAVESLSRIGYTRNTNKSSASFLLRDRNGIECAIGFYNDVSMLEKVNSVAKRYPDQTFKIVCFSWQKDMYVRVTNKNVIVVTEIE